MKPVTGLFLLGELLDVATTYIGLTYYGLVEANPVVHFTGWTVALISKAFFVWGTCMFLQLRRVRWYSLFPLALSWSAVLYNTYNIAYVIIGG